jgi:hypothetical protein
MGVMVSPALQVHLDHQEHASNVPVAVEPKHQLTLQEIPTNLESKIHLNHPLVMVSILAILVEIPHNHSRHAHLPPVHPTAIGLRMSAHQNLAQDQK